MSIIIQPQGPPTKGLMKFQGCATFSSNGRMDFFHVRGSSRRLYSDDTTLLKVTFHSWCNHKQVESSNACVFININSLLSHVFMISIMNEVGSRADARAIEGKIPYLAPSFVYITSFRTEVDLRLMQK